MYFTDKMILTKTDTFKICLFI